MNENMNENIRDKWSANLDEEIAFWRKELLNWKADPNNVRMTDEHPLEWHVREYFPEGDEYDILDVGAGPISALGNKWWGKKLNIKAVDPLADVYNDIMQEYGMVPRVVTEKLDGERLSDSLSLDSFDFVYVKNALDHTYNPFRCIDEILKVLKVNCCCSLDHMVNEGTSANWNGLHQWDFYYEGNTFFIADKGHKNIVNMNERLEDRAEIICKPLNRAAKSQRHDPLFAAVIKKI
jgi:hypothetical protein